MKRIYYSHNLREDWNQGLYNKTCSNQEEKIKTCVFMLGMQTVFEHYAVKVIEKWPYACAHYLTDSGRNKQAYIGQAACCFYCGAPEFITKIAWNKLDKKTQESANKTADKVIKDFIKKLENKNQLKLYEDIS